MPPARSHDKNRNFVCFLCLKKADRELAAFTKQKAVEVLKKEIHFNNSRVQLGICYECRSSLRKVSEGEKANRPHLFGFF